MKKSELSSKKYLGFFAFLAAHLAVGAVLTAALFRSYSGNGFFGTSGLRLAVFLTVAVLIAVFAVFSRFSDGFRFDAQDGRLASVLPGSVTSAMLLVLTFDFVGEAKGASALLKGCSILCAVFALCAVAYLLLRSFARSVAGTTLSYFAVLSAFFYGLCAVYLYFEKSIPINAPVKIFEQVALLSLSMESLLSARVCLDREKPRLHYAVLASAAGLSLAASLPVLIYAIVKGTIVSANLYVTLLLFVASVSLIVKAVGSQSAGESELSDTSEENEFSDTAEENELSDIKEENE